MKKNQERRDKHGNFNRESTGPKHPSKDERTEGSM
jgi:hypothetical protein